ncbi:MAG: hypothetical protein AAF518_12020 [Spirochaetota bacterium]
MKQALLIFLGTFLLTNCAFLEKRNRPLTTYLDQQIQPESTPGKIALFPIVMPVGFVSLASDILVLHPISTIPEAVKDSSEYIWEDPKGGIVQQTFLFLPKSILTPIFLISDIIVRSIFDVN